LYQSRGPNKPAILNTGQGIIPSKEGRKETKDTTSLLQCNGGGRITHVIGVLLASEEQERQIKGEEEQEEHDSRSESAEKQECGKNKPASQEKANRAGNVPFVRSSRRGDAPVRG
jgi:hypothetical protein